MKTTRKATLEPEEIKLFTATYNLSFKGDNWPIQVQFTNRIVTDAPIQQNHLNGFYEVCSWRGDSMACGQFEGEILNTPYRRKEFDVWLKSQMS